MATGTTSPRTFMERLRDYTEDELREAAMTLVARAMDAGEALPAPVVPVVQILLSQSHLKRLPADAMRVRELLVATRGIFDGTVPLGGPLP